MDDINPQTPARKKGNIDRAERVYPQGKKKKEKKKKRTLKSIKIQRFVSRDQVIYEFVIPKLNYSLHP